MRNILMVAAILIIAGCQAENAVTDDEQAGAPPCDGIPRAANARLPLNDASDEWFQVYESAPGVYSIVEPYHFEETISHLIVGADRAILFDTGMGFLPIRRVVERITRLPVTVLNSHTHYDHVGGNAEFSSILAVDSDYTRANMAGFPHERLVSDIGPEAFCKGTPGFDRNTFYTKPWKATGHVADGDILDLGGRRLQVLRVPGHTPDAIALIDAENGLLFTGDSFYDGPIWLFVPETSLVDYGRSIARLAKLEPGVRFLLGSHNVARVDTGALAKVAAAYGKLVSRNMEPIDDDDGRLLFHIDDVEFLTARPVLAGQQGDTGKGGSGLDTWP